MFSIYSFGYNSVERVTCPHAMLRASVRVLIHRDSEATGQTFIGAKTVSNRFLRDKWYTLWSLWFFCNYFALRGN